MQELFDQNIQVFSRNPNLGSGQCVSVAPGQVRENPPPPLPQSFFLQQIALNLPRAYTDFTEPLWKDLSSCL